MGNLLKRGNKYINWPDEPQNIIFSTDKTLKYEQEKIAIQLESYFSIFKKYQLSDFAYELLNYVPKKRSAQLSSKEVYLDINTISSYDEKSFREKMEMDDIESFYSYLIEKNELSSQLKKISSKKSLNDMKKIFIKQIRKLYDTIQEYFNNDLDEQYTLKKLNILYFGILYCDCKNGAKLTMFFNLFREINEQNISKFGQNLNLDSYIKEICFICGKGIVESRTCCNEELGKFNEEDIKLITPICGLQTSQAVLSNFNEKFFNGAEDIKYEFDRFITMFTEKEYGWIFNRELIREKLNENKVE